jgi:hypothetical protein
LLKPLCHYAIIFHDWENNASIVNAQSTCMIVASLIKTFSSKQAGNNMETMVQN